MKTALNVCWFRRDLRLTDNAALYHALKAGLPVLPIFIFDRNILDDLEDRTDLRVQYIHDAITEMQSTLTATGSTLKVYYGYPEQVFLNLIEEFEISKVFANGDYEAYAQDRDSSIGKILSSKNVGLQLYKDHVIFEKNEIAKDDGKPYTVFTPYSRRWKEKLNDFFLRPYPVEKYQQNYFKQDAVRVPELEEMGFIRTTSFFPSREVSDDLLIKYGKNRDYPGIEGTSRMGVHLRFGTISIRELAKQARKASEIYLNELIWRDFYQMVLWQFPHLGRGQAFKPEYDRIAWRNNETEFKTWCEGRTGYPMVDAGIRELNATGFMHNRVRMVVASFLSKHLLIDWRWGESYFAAKLLDFDFASNNGGWQWAAGTGCDAAPFFRIFNPALQAKKFDPDQTYIKRWIPELGEMNYPEPIVEHKFARDRCLKAYKLALAR